MRTILAAVALVALAFAGCVDDGESNQGPKTVTGVEPMAPELSAAYTLEMLLEFVTDYPERAANLPDHWGARDYLATKFADAGLEVWRHNFTTNIEQQNIVGIKWGKDRDNWVVIGGHYDMASRDCGFTGAVLGPVPEGPDCAGRPLSAGAYDDGSGTLMTVHLAQAFANVTTDYTLAFVAFDGEERGLEGSGAFVQSIIEQDHPYGAVNVRGMVDLDMIGLNWPGVDVPIYFDSNSPELEARLAAKASELGMPEEAISYQGISLGRSDYAHFFDLGVPTCFFISDFEEWQMPANIPFNGPTTPAGSPVAVAYPFWHVTDTYETMEQMAGSPEDLEAGFQTALELAADQILLLATDGKLTVIPDA